MSGQYGALFSDSVRSVAYNTDHGTGYCGNSGDYPDGLDQILTNVIKPLKKLESHMKKVNLENLNEKVVIDTDDEISHLAGKFNSMLERIENLKEQVVEEQEDKRKYELQALQAQINPHFLYNTLDSIIWMAEGKKRRGSTYDCFSGAASQAKYQY